MAPSLLLAKGRDAAIVSPLAPTMVPSHALLAARDGAIAGAHGDGRGKAQHEVLLRYEW